MRGTASPDTAWLWQAAKLLILLIGLIALALLLWRLSHVVLLVFAAVLVAVLLRAAAGPIERFTPLSGPWSVGLAGLIIGAALAGFVWLMGAQIQAQARVLLESLPDLAAAADEQLGIEGLDEWARERVGEVVQEGDMVASVASYSTWAIDMVVSTLVVLASGVYLALNPRLYRSGLLLLVPPAQEEEARTTLDAIGRALKLWLLGQLVAMGLVGLLTTLGLWLLDIPSALALGALAGVLEFVPFVGPLVSAVPAVALGLTESPSTALWVIGLYVLIQQIEGNLITPLVQQHTVDLPPVLTIFGIIAFGVLFGPLGILLATPLAVVCFVLVKKLWVREVLHEETELPGENAEVSPARTSEGR